MIRRMMSLPGIVVCVVMGMTLLAANVASQDPPAEGTEPAPELFDHMLEVKSIVRDLVRSAADPANKEESLQLMTELQEHIVAAKSMIPPAAELKPEAERPAFLLGFRRAMTELLREITELELDIIEDRNEQAVQRITTTIIAMRDKAHEVFQTD